MPPGNNRRWKKDLKIIQMWARELWDELKRNNIKESLSLRRTEMHPNKTVTIKDISLKNPRAGEFRHPYPRSPKGTIKRDPVKRPQDIS